MSQGRDFFYKEEHIPERIRVLRAPYTTLSPAYTNPRKWELVVLGPIPQNHLDWQWCVNISKGLHGAYHKLLQDRCDREVLRLIRRARQREKASRKIKEGVHVVPRAEVVKTASDLVSIVRRSQELRRTGSRFTTRCPFHNEKTPSLVIFPENQTWHCYGCHVGGDVISWVMKIYSCSFKEALVRLHTHTL